MKCSLFFMSGVLCSSLLLTDVQAAVAAPIADEINRPNISINGEKQALQGVISPNNHTLVPFKEFFSALNIKATFTNQSKTVVATNHDTTLILTAGKTVALLNGKEVLLQQAPQIMNGRMYVNLRFIAESFGGTVQFDQKKLEISINFQDITGLTSIWANALKTRDGKPRYQMMSQRAQERFVQEQINVNGEEGKYVIGVSSPWVVDFEFEIESMTATILYRTATSEPAFYQTKEILTFIEENGQLVVDDYQTIFEDQPIK